VEFTLALLGIAFVAGGFGALLGVGGGFIVVPALSLLLGVPMHEAIGSSITAVIATSSAGATSYLKRNYVNVRAGMLLEVPTAIGAVAGGLAAVSVSGKFLQGLFAVVLLYISYTMARSRDSDAQVYAEIESESWMAASFNEPTTQTEVSYVPLRAPLAMGVSILAGAVSGMFGVGGGIVKVPVMAAIMSMPVRAAMATSTYMIGLTGAASAFIYYSHGFAPPAIAGPTAIGVLVGARVGSKVFRRVKPKALVLLFSALMFFSAVKMALEAVR